MKIGQHKRKSIDDVAFDILKQSKAFGVFPTPVDRIIGYCDLHVEENNYLDSIPSNYVAKSKELLKRALRKVRGALDRTTKTIYLEPGQISVRQNFVKLHEAGHQAIPWQKQLFEYIQDDESTLTLDSREEFEVEANWFASSALFQLDRFDEEADKLPLEIGTPMQLASKFGGSNHASLRRYVERSPKKCSLLILESPSKRDFVCNTKSYFQSSTFTSEFGRISWESALDAQWPFVLDYVTGRKFKKDGFFELDIKGLGKTYFDYHYFNNGWNAFVFIKPCGETIKSKTKIVINY